MADAADGSLELTASQSHRSAANKAEALGKRRRKVEAEAVTAKRVADNRAEAQDKRRRQVEAGAVTAKRVADNRAEAILKRQRTVATKRATVLAQTKPEEAAACEDVLRDHPSWDVQAVLAEGRRRSLLRRAILGASVPTAASSSGSSPNIVGDWPGFSTP